jgi:hypothetical protein
MAEWLLISAVLLMGLYFIAPAQLPVFLYKANLVAFFAFMGYWLDRRLFWYARPGDDANPLIQLRRAIVVGAALLAGAYGL